MDTSPAARSPAETDGSGRGGRPAGGTRELGRGQAGQEAVR